MTIDSFFQVAELYKHMEDRGQPINKNPTIDGREVDLYRLFKVVYKAGGQARVTNKNMWQQVDNYSIKTVIDFTYK